MANNNIIDLNGKWYDALTGAQLADAPSTATVQHMPVQAAPGTVRSGGSVDGFINTSSSVKPKPVSSRSTYHIAAHQPQTTQTLMRRAVKQPVAIQKPALQTTTPLQQSAGSVPIVTPKLSSMTIDPHRSRRAQAAGRSQAVRHFTSSGPAVMSDFAQSRPAGPVVQPVTTQPSAIPLTDLRQAQPIRPQQTLQNPANQHSTAAFVAARRTPGTAGFTVSTSVQKSAQTLAPSMPDQDIFEAALASATSHNQPAPNEAPLLATKRSAKKHRQVLSIVGSVMVFLLLVGFIAYQNKANIQYQLASARAGFAASMPNYKPSGYSLGKLQYASGTVAALYQNKTNNNAISIVQKKSNWDSQTLLDNFVTSASGNYQGYSANGRTVYVYDNNATWVNGGIWYQIHANQPMDAGQLVKIAANM